MSYYLKVFIVSFTILGIFSVGLFVLAGPGDVLTEGLKKAGEGSFTGADGKTAPVRLETTAAMLIRQVLGLTGIAALIVVIYAGFLYVTAGGQEKKVEKAQSLLKYAGIGLVLIFGAYVIANTVIKALEETTVKTSVISGILRLV